MLQYIKMLQVVVLLFVTALVAYSMIMFFDDIDRKLILAVGGTWLLVLAVLLYKYSNLNLPGMNSLSEGKKDQFKTDIMLLAR